MEHVTAMSIGEFARASGLSASALRFYDSSGLITPDEVDPATGYRRYSPQQVAVAELVRDLRRLEMPIALTRVFLAAPSEIRHKLLEDHLASLTDRQRERESLARAVRTALCKEEDMSMTVSAPELGGAIDQVAPAAGTDLERPLLQNVLVEARDGSLRLVATDSYRLAIRDLVPKAGEGNAFRALLPAARLSRARAELPASGEVAVSLVKRHLHVIGSDTEIELEVTSAAEYPDYEALMSPERSASSVILEREPVLSAVGDLLEADLVRLELSELRVAVDRQEVAISESWTGPAMTIGLNPRYFHQALQAAVGPDIWLEINTPAKPLVIRSATDGSFVCLLMPVKLD